MPVLQASVSTGLSRTLTQQVFVPLTRKHSPGDWFVRLANFVLPVTFLARVILQPWVGPKWMFLPLTAAQLSGGCCRTRYGFVSVLGVIPWVAIAAVGCFSAAQLLATGFSGPILRFALTAVLLNGWRALDDASLVSNRIPEQGSR